jgi:hypothetical protein
VVAGYVLPELVYTAGVIIRPPAPISQAYKPCSHSVNNKWKGNRMTSLIIRLCKYVGILHVQTKYLLCSQSPRKHYRLLMSAENFFRMNVDVKVKSFSENITFLQMKQFKGFNNFKLMMLSF